MLHKLGEGLPIVVGVKDCADDNYPPAIKLYEEIPGSLDIDEIARKVKEAVIETKKVMTHILHEEKWNEEESSDQMEI